MPQNSSPDSPYLKEEMDSNLRVRVNPKLQHSLAQGETVRGIGSKTDLVKRFLSLLPLSSGNEFRRILLIGTTSVESAPKRLPEKPKFGLVAPAGLLFILNVLTNGGILL